MATHIKADGTVAEVQPKNGTDFDLDEMKSLIGGGFVGHGFLDGGDVLIADEDGYFKKDKLPFNATATRQFGIAYYGDVVVLSREEFGLAQKTA